MKRLDGVSRSPIFANFSETISGVSTIRAYGKQGSFIDLARRLPMLEMVTLMFVAERVADRQERRGVLSWSHNKPLACAQVCGFVALLRYKSHNRLELIGNLILFFAAVFAVLERSSDNAGFVGFALSYALSVTQVSTLCLQCRS